MQRLRGLEAPVTAATGVQNLLAIPHHNGNRHGYVSPEKGEYKSERIKLVSAIQPVADMVLLAREMSDSIST